MAKIKLVQAERIFIPDVDFPTDEGIINNRKQPPEDQVTAEIKMATIEEKTRYLDSYSETPTGKKAKKAGAIKSYIAFRYNECLKKHCGPVKGLEDFGVTSGITLMDKAAEYPVLNDVIREIFFKINGIHDDDSEGGDAGEMTEGEEQASV